MGYWQCLYPFYLDCVLRYETKMRGLFHVKQRIVGRRKHADIDYSIIAKAILKMMKEDENERHQNNTNVHSEL